jgi:fructose-specific phosphotransferase system component IIB
MSKTIKLTDEKLKKLLKDKSELIHIGREKSDEIMKLEEQMAETDKQLQEEEKKVNLDEFLKREKSITKRMEKCISDINKVKEEICAKVKKETPQELRDKYEKLKKQKEEKEIERNKVGLKAQKFTDLIIPLARKLMTPYLENEYDDYESLKLENDEIVCSIFNHVEEFKSNFNKKKKN